MCISAYSLMPYFSLLLSYISFISCTCWVPIISVLSLAIFLCYSNLLLRRRRWTGILRWGVLGYASPRLPFLWCYGIFRCSVSSRVTLVFKDINYVITILYIYDIWLSVSTFGRMCGTIDPGSCIRWVPGFGIKTGYDMTSQCSLLIETTVVHRYYATTIHYRDTVVATGHVPVATVVYSPLLQLCVIVVPASSLNIFFVSSLRFPD
jgi:hypothetical protein